MDEIIGEPVAEADALYRPKFEARERTKNVCWRYYYEESFWDMRLQ